MLPAALDIYPPGVYVQSVDTRLKLGLFCLLLVAIFGTSYVAGAELVPEATVAEWTSKADKASSGHERTGDGTNAMPHDKEPGDAR